MPDSLCSEHPRERYPFHLIEAAVLHLLLERCHELQEGKKASFLAASSTNKQTESALGMYGAAVAANEIDFTFLGNLLVGTD